MKIVVLGLRGIPNIQGGVETHCEHLYTRMAARGHKIIIIGRRPYMDSSITEHKGVKLIAVNCPKKKSFEAFIHTLIGVFEARKFNPDILHIHAIGPALLVPLAKMLGMKVINTNHGADYERMKWGWAAKLMLRLGEKLGSRFSDTVIAISHPIADKLQSAYGCKPLVIPNGVVVRKRHQKQDELDKLGLTPGKYFLAVSRLVPEKGLHDLLDAFASAQPNGWKLVIAGRADHEDIYSQKLLQTATHIPNVVMAGFVNGEPLEQLYSHAGLFVLPSHHEGLPIVLLEAMSYGLPVLASDIPANRQAGLPEARFFPVGDVQALTQKILSVNEYLLDKKSSSQQIEQIAKNFNWDSITDETLNSYIITSKIYKK